MNERFHAVVGTHDAFRSFARDRSWDLEWSKPDRFKLRNDPRVFVHVPTLRHAFGIEWDWAEMVGPVGSENREHWEAYEYVRSKVALRRTSDAD